jgi:hypothetical protein
MKTIHFALSVALVMVSTLAVSGEGGPSWWWDCNGDDFIVRGTIEHGDQPHIEIKWNHEGKQLTTYYIRGKLKIHEVLYLNPQNRYPDNYKHYLKDLTQERDVLLPARRVHWDHMTKDDLKVTPTIELPTDPAIMVLNVDYVFPIGGLVLQSVVPGDKEAEAEGLIKNRSNDKETAKPNTEGDGLKPAL